MGNVIALIVTVAIAVGAIVYIVRAKKSGKKCIGCPDGCGSAKEHGCSSCAHCCGCDKDANE